MILADTSLWIEFLKGRDPIFSIFQDVLERMEILSCEVVFAELVQGARNPDEVQRILDYWEHVPSVSLEGLWIEAGRYSSEKRLFQKGVGLIDALLIVVSKKSQSRIWTLDKKLLQILPKQSIYTA